MKKLAVGVFVLTAGCSASFEAFKPTGLDTKVQALEAQNQAQTKDLQTIADWINKQIQAGQAKAGEAQQQPGQ